MDTINDELLACYVEGIATPEEQTLVRDYLAKNPEEYERVLYMIDLDREDYINEFEEDIASTVHNIALKESSITNIAYSAAAFAPQEKKMAAKITQKSLRTNGLHERLCKLLEETKISK